MIEDILVIIPAYNEEKAIGKILKELKKYFKNILVIDDGSIDRTKEIVQKEKVLLISHITNKGKGEALKTGFKYAIEKNFPAVITMDGDGQHLPEETLKFVEEYRKKTKIGILIGKRSIFSQSMPLIRRITNLSMSFLISILSFQWIPDTQCGFRLIKTDTLKKIKLYTSHFETESEILIKAGCKGIRIKSLPIKTIYRKEKSKIRPIRDTVRFFKMFFLIFFTSFKKYEKRF
ncbi:MAG TPA: glycosyltransferase family 2 protein [bacterium]|nr:glycosyltransferase family 2 protein [bacterium]HOM26591.1 glycosyltransferase family 2 protein [bacterium]